jgi:hypothetical protein
MGKLKISFFILQDVPKTRHGDQSKLATSTPRSLVAVTATTTSGDLETRLGSDGELHVTDEGRM